MEWIYDAMENKWELYADAQSDEVLAEVGQDEDGTYYWVSLDDNCGYTDFETAAEAMTDADGHFDMAA